MTAIVNQLTSGGVVTNLGDDTTTEGSSVALGNRDGREKDEGVFLPAPPGDPPRDPPCESGKDESEDADTDRERGEGVRGETGIAAPGVEAVIEGGGEV